MRFTKLLLVLICAGLPVLAASGQTLDPLIIFYLEGVYAEVRASFTRMSPKEPIGLNLNEGFVIRLGHVESYLR
jgi:hypothetical protein